MNVFKGRIIEDRSAVVQGRVVDKTKTLYVAANLSTIHYRIVRLDTGAEVVAETALSPVSTYIITPFDWDGSREQANFRHVIANTVFDTGGLQYEIQYKFTGTDGTVGGGIVRPTTIDMAGV